MFSEREHTSPFRGAPDTGNDNIDDVALVREAWLLSAVRESQWEAGVLAPSVVRDDRMCLQLF